MQFFRSSRYLALILVLGTVGLVKAAIIAPGAPDFKMVMQVGTGAPYPLTATSVTPIQQGDKWAYQVDGTYNQHGYEMSVSFTIEPDPSVFGNVTIRDTTATTQDYTFLFTFPASVSSPALMNGSVGVTVTADATPAVVATTAPDALYQALIDSTTVKTLLNHPFALPAAAFDSATATDRFGIPVPVSGPGVATDIGIKLHFNLTTGDQAGVTSQFTVNAVPEPTSLLGLALGGLVLVRRRK